MSPCCDLDLEVSNKTKILHDSGSWCCITIPNLVTKCPVIQKISSGLSLTMWTFTVTLTLNPVIPFFHRTLQLIMLYYQTKFGCKLTHSLDDTTGTVIFLFYKPSLWPWHWTQWTNFSARHSGLWCCKSIPGLATKCSMVQKISSRQTLTNILSLRCDLELGCSNPIFP